MFLIEVIRTTLYNDARLSLVYLVSTVVVGLVVVAAEKSINKKLYKHNSSLWVLDYILNVLFILSAFYIFKWVNNLIFLPLFLFFIGARQHALGLLGHEAAHYCAFKSRNLNVFFGDFFIAWPLFVCISGGYRPWHFEHHKFLGTKLDPELNYRAFAPYVSNPSSGTVIRYFFTDMFGLGVLDLLKFMKEIFPKKNPALFIGPIIWWGGFFAICQCFQSLWIFWLWAGSLMTGFWAVFRVRTWAEHIAAPGEGKFQSHRFSASVIPRFLFFPHNTHYHYEHHIWPQIPYYNLPLARKEDKSRSIVKLIDVFPNGSVNPLESVLVPVNVHVAEVGGSENVGRVTPDKSG